MSTNRTECVLVYVTTPSNDVAESLARSSMEKRLAAGANIIHGVKSIYHWKGKIESADEHVVIFKTRESLFADLEMHILTHHPYETPCIVAIPIEAGSEAFLGWVIDETTQA